MDTLRMTPALRRLLALTFPAYRGRKYRLAVACSVTLHDRDWSGGTHADYIVLRDVGNGIEQASTPTFRPSDGAAAYAPTVDLPAGYIVVSHRLFCGHDMGITIYVNPDGRAPACLLRARRDTAGSILGKDGPGAGP